MKTQTDCRREIMRLCGELVRIAKDSTPQGLQAVLVGVVANTVGNLDAEDWAEFQNVAPCGKLGCDCEVIRAEFLKFATFAREYHLAAMKGTRRSAPKHAGGAA